MNILGIDYGKTHLGLAFSPDRKVSYQLLAISYQQETEAVEKIKKVCEEYEISQVVIGLPLDQKGNLSKQAKKVKEFGGALEKTLNLHKKIKISYWNETLTSTEARQKMLEAQVPRYKRKELEHSFAAQIVLQEYLDFHCSEV